MEFADKVIEEFTNQSTKLIDFHKREKILIIKLVSTADEKLYNNEKYNIKYELKINDYGFQFKKTNTSDLTNYEYTISCKRHSQQSIFMKEYFSELRSIKHNVIHSSVIESNNQIDIFDDVQQLSHEENEVHITCFPSSEGIAYTKRKLDEKRLVMKITNS